MKKVIFPVLILAFVFCGQQPKAPVIDVDKITGKDVVYEPLTEAELVNFIKVFPVYRAELEKKGIAWQSMSPSDDPFTRTRAALGVSKDLAEIDRTLKAAGMGIAEFYPALMKTTLVFAAVMFDTAMTEAKAEIEKSKAEMAKLEAQLNDPKVPAAQKTMIKAALEATKAITEGVAKMGSIYESVPKENKDLVKKYFPQLKEVFDAK